MSGPAVEFVETRTTCPLPPILGVQILKRRSISACSSARRGTVDEVVVVFPPGVPGTGITAAEGADDGSGKAGVLGAAELDDAQRIWSRFAEEMDLRRGLWERLNEQLNVFTTTLCRLNDRDVEFARRLQLQPRGARCAHGCRA